VDRCATRLSLSTGSSAGHLHLSGNGGSMYSQATASPLLVDGVFAWSIEVESELCLCDQQPEKG
jgi:hypothetical protein